MEPKNIALSLCYIQWVIFLWKWCCIWEGGWTVRFHVSYDGVDTPTFWWCTGPYLFGVYSVNFQNTAPSKSQKDLDQPVCLVTWIVNKVFISSLATWGHSKRLRITTQEMNSWATITIETRLKDNIPDAASLLLYCADRNLSSSKKKGGGVWNLHKQQLVYRYRQPWKTLFS